ncbi:extracellular solute-binding protein [Halosimplex aquaticum]
MAGQRESRRAFLAAAAGASASLAGCARGALARRSATASSRDLADRIVFYNAGDLQFDPGTRRNIERFEAETGITVEVPEVPWPDLKTTLTTVWNNRSSRIDVWNGPTWWLADFVQSGWLEPLDLPASHMEKFPQNLRDLVTFDGRVYMAPQLGKWGTFLYDSDYLDRLGYDHPPRTWTELLETGEMLTGDERAGFAVPWANKDVFTFKQFLYQAGGQLFDGNEPVFVEEGSVALEFLRRLGDRGVLPADAMELGQPGVRRAFIDGRLATVESWTPLGARTLDADGWDADRLGTAKPPAGPASRATFQDTNGIGVSAFSQRKRAAAVRRVHDDDRVGKARHAGRREPVGRPRRLRRPGGTRPVSERAPRRHAVQPRTREKRDLSRPVPRRRLPLRTDHARDARPEGPGDRAGRRRCEHQTALQ